MTLEILISTIDKGVVRVSDILLPKREDVKYIICFQYTDNRYLDLIPNAVLKREDVSFYKIKGKGLSVNRNFALDRATCDILLFADDDARLLPDTFDNILKVFKENEDVDIAYFQATTYMGKELKHYPKESFKLERKLPAKYNISAIEMAVRRSKVQDVIRFDERFGLGAEYLTCGEEEIWFEDAHRAHLNMVYFPVKIIETSTLLKQKMVYVDMGVQRSIGAIAYYKYGAKAWRSCFAFAMNKAKGGYCHFVPMFKHLTQGIRYIKCTQK